MALLALAVLWSAQAFPAVPGQKLGAGFLPSIVGVGLLVCGLALVVRSVRGTRYEGGDAVREAEHIGPPLVVIGAVVLYIVLADRIGFLLVAPLCLMMVFRAMQVRWLPAVLWALGCTLLVHVAFYKLLRVPLPWGVIRPFF
jgi:putative tricarboxylic transport membrane protein